MAEFGLSVGTPDVKSVGPITFGPDNVLFVADNVTAKVVALDVADEAPAAPAQAFDLEGLDAKLAAFLGCAVDDVVIRDLAVHPRTHNIYISLMRGKGDAALPVIAKLDARDATISDVALRDLAFSEIGITNAPSADDERTDVQLGDPGEGEPMDIHGITLHIARPPARTATVTDLAYVDGQLLVAGMSNEEFSSNLRRIAFPFTGEQVDNSLEIYHVSHGAWETAAPIRTFVPFEGGQSILASYTCTPLVHFSLADLAGGTKAVGHTVAELGNRNQPLDIVSFDQGGREFLLIAHSRHPMMKIACDDIDPSIGLTDQSSEGVARQEIDLPGVRRLANLNGEFVLALVRDESGASHLRSLKTASL